MMIANGSNTGAKVLVVDYSPSGRDSIIADLEFGGFVVVGVSGGETALETLGVIKFDLVLIDLMMPGMNGLQLARKIRELFPLVKTMLMSSYLLSPIQLAKVDVGVIGFVPKPYNARKLVWFIRGKIETLCIEDSVVQDAMGGAGFFAHGSCPVAL